MRDKQIQKIMQNAFDQMGYKFTSYDLLLLAKSNGVTDQNIKNGVVRRFLAGKAVNDKGPRQWIKVKQIWKKQQQENVSEELPIFADNNDDSHKIDNRDGSRKGLKDGYIRATYILKESMVDRIKDIAYWDRLDIKDVINDLLLSALASRDQKEVKLNDVQMIEYFKSKGYRVMKPNTDWEEL
jgi:hypothetical protein